MLYALFYDGKIRDVFSSAGAAEEAFEELYRRMPEYPSQLVAVELCCRTLGNDCSKCSEVCLSGGLPPYVNMASTIERQMILDWLADEARMLDEAERGEYDPRVTFERR